MKPTNIMHDPRVFRGPTFGLNRKLQNESESSQSTNRSFRKYSASSSIHFDTNRSTSKSKSNTNKLLSNRSKTKTTPSSKYKKMTNSTPLPVQGRTHIETQTDSYLEEITIKPKLNTEAVQTDPFLDLPPTPHFVPKPNGISIGTQIMDGDLFNFDQEIEPLLEVLCGKTIKQSLEEVLEEEELAMYKKYQFEFEQRRNIEINKCQKLEEEFRRKEEEKARRIKQLEEQKIQKQKLEKKIEAQQFAKEVMIDLENKVINELDRKGAFCDPIKKEIEDIFMPNFIKNVLSQVNQQKIMYQCLDDILQTVVQNTIEECETNIARIDQENKVKKQKEMERIKLETTFAEMEMTIVNILKMQKDDYDIADQIASLLQLSIEEKNDDEKAENTEAQQNLQFVESVVEKLKNDEDIFELLKSKISGDINEKIQLMKAYKANYEVKKNKLSLLSSLKQKEDEQLMHAITSFSKLDAFDEEHHLGIINGIKSEDAKANMESINLMISHTKEIESNINEHIKNFLKTDAEAKQTPDQPQAGQESETN